jgi:hypothetical protein
VPAQSVVRRRRSRRTHSRCGAELHLCLSWLKLVIVNLNVFPPAPVALNIIYGGAGKRELMRKFEKNTRNDIVRYGVGNKLRAYIQTPGPIIQSINASLSLVFMQPLAKQIQYVCSSQGLLELRPKRWWWVR